MKATMSILALYNWDNTIFDNLTIPEGISPADLEMSLLMECAELELLYPDFEVMKNFIGIWSRKELPVWERVYRASQLEYNPIDNYNRSELWTDSVNGGRTVNNSQVANNSMNSTGNRLGKVAGYNSDSLVPREGSDDSQNTSGSGTVTDSGSETRNETTTRSGNVHGNIGVTSSQQMLEQELEIAPKLNTIDYIIASFKRRFCLLVYT